MSSREDMTARMFRWPRGVGLTFPPTQGRNRVRLGLEGRNKQNWGCVDADRNVGVLFWGDKLGGASQVCGQVREPHLEAGLGWTGAPEPALLLPLL